MADNGAMPRRELDEEKTGQRAGTPVGFIRKPMALPAMEPIHTRTEADLATPSEDELRRRPFQVSCASCYSTAAPMQLSAPTMP